jgi:hypothetical protein
MSKKQAGQPRKTNKVFANNLFEATQAQFPGVSDMLAVYADYEEMALEMRQYLEVAQPLPFITTSNRSNP